MVRRRRSVVGVEITQEAVRAAEITTGSFPTLIAYGEAALPAGAARDFAVSDRDVVAGAIQRLWQTAGLSRRNLVLGVGGRSVFVREVDLRSIGRRDLAAALPTEVAALLPAPVDQVVMDFYPLVEQRGASRGLLVAAAAVTIERMIAGFSRAQAQVSSVDLVAFGLARIAGRLGRAGETTLSIHVGDHSTHVVVAVGGAPQLVRTIRAEMLTSAIVRRATSAVVEPTPAIAIVTDQGGRAGLRIGAQALAPAPKRTKEPADAVAALAARVHNVAESYRTRVGAARIGTVFVSGAGIVAPGLEQALSSVLKRPLRTVGVEQLVSTRQSAPTGELRLDLVSTVGLALGEAR
jgi:type IV pilus assembly protein PilM